MWSLRGVGAPAAQGMLLSSLREEEAQPLRTPEGEPVDSQAASQHCLWVDTFAPRRYTELLSDDVSFVLLECDWLLCCQEGEGCRTRLIFMLSAPRTVGWREGLGSACGTKASRGPACWGLSWDASGCGGHAGRGQGQGYRGGGTHESHSATCWQGSRCRSLVTQPQCPCVCLQAYDTG